MAPYWLLDSPYSLVSVKIVLAAGIVTRTMPCTGPAALMIVSPVVEASGPPGSSALRSVRWVLSPDTAVCPPGRVLPSPSRDEAALRDGYRGILTEVLSALQEP